MASAKPESSGGCGAFTFLAPSEFQHGSKTAFRLLEPNDLSLLKNFMNVGWNDLNRVQEPGQYPFRDGTIFITFAEIAMWKRKPDAEFQLMRKHPIQSQVAYVLGKQV